ncbi:MAG: hypothetical protein KKA65_03420 [Nanoarchaeota archaeon]|nr:hypothetical protein [Nanoarchaeota archaeon]MBU4351972.1 hypothetical protein [Nanoarchaeota archaeon]MBU4456528.1 hypothetical protein [Nanoarchaeota archaeon]MCG2719331.1 hypothetical protein [Nanoarchaeota archaeon]
MKLLHKFLIGSLAMATSLCLYYEFGSKTVQGTIVNEEVGNLHSKLSPHSKSYLIQKEDGTIICADMRSLEDPFDLGDKVEMELGILPETCRKIEMRSFKDCIEGICAEDNLNLKQMGEVCCTVNYEVVCDRGCYKVKGFKNLKSNSEAKI